jgi:superfamily II DNA or RNA helicase
MERYIEMGFNEADAQEAFERFADDLHRGCHWLMVRSTMGHVPKKLKVRNKENTYIGSTVRFNGVTWTIDTVDSVHALVRMVREDGLPSRWEHMSDQRIEWVTVRHEKHDNMVPRIAWLRKIGEITVSSDFKKSMKKPLTLHNALSNYIRFGRPSEHRSSEWEKWRFITTLTRSHTHCPSRRRPREAYSSDIHDFRVEWMSYFHVLCDIHTISIDAFSNCLYNESVDDVVSKFPETIRDSLRKKIIIWKNPQDFLKEEMIKWNKDCLPLIIFECTKSVEHTTFDVKIHDMTFVNPREQTPGRNSNLQRLFFHLYEESCPKNIPGPMDKSFFNSILRASKKKCAPLEPSESFTGELFPFQKKCLNWLIERETTSQPLSAWGWTKRELDDGFIFYTSVFGYLSLTPPNMSFRGGLLAQDVGLGKTVEMLALITTHKADGPTLVVVPTTMLNIWVSEAARYAPSLKVVKFHGNRRTKDMNELRHADIVITTYRVVVNETQQHVPSIGAVRWGRLILDESHEMRGIHSATSRAVCRLFSPYRWCVSATPWPKELKNILSSLSFFGVAPFKDANEPLSMRSHSLMSPALMCSILSHSTWWQQKRHVRMQLPTVTNKDVYLKYGYTNTYNQLLSAIRKRIALDRGLPNNRTRLLHYTRWLRQAAVHPMLNRISCYGLPTDQAKIQTETNSMETFIQTLGSTKYDESLRDLIYSWSQGNEKCSICMDAMDRPTLTPCNHMFCFECIQSSYQHDQKRKCPLCREPAGNSVLKEITIEEPGECHQMNTTWCTQDINGQIVEMEKSVHEQIMNSSKEYGIKIEHTMNMIQTRDEKFIVFTQFNGTLVKLCTALTENGIAYASIEGRMSPLQREKAINKFQSEKKVRVFVMTTKTASVGITLTAGSHVVFVEPLDNIHVRKQAIGRAWRIGQKNPVTVTTLYAQNTIDCAKDLLTHVGFCGVHV